MSKAKASRNNVQKDPARAGRCVVSMWLPPVVTMRGDGFHSGASGLGEKCAKRTNPLAPCRRGRLWHSIASRQGYAAAFGLNIRRMEDCRCRIDDKLHRD